MKIIGLAGAAGTGKTTLAHRFATAIQDEATVLVQSFAAPIRSMMFELIPRLGRPHTLGKDEELYNGVTLRRALQTLGTEWARETLGPDVWVACMETYAKKAHDAFAPDPVIVVIDDVRFPNEVKWVQDAGGVVVALTRSGATQAAPAHASEQFDTIAKMPGVVPFHMAADRSQEDHLDEFIDLIEEHTSWL